MKIHKLHFALILAFSAWSCYSSVACAQRRLLPIDDFDGGIQNLVGGFRNTFEKSPSTADAMRVPEARYGRDGLGLRITANRNAAGFCGYWIHFFDVNARVRRYVDATDYKFLSFLVKGESGGEQFTVKLADERWIEKEDSVAIGAVDEFLIDGVTTEWQEVLVPLDADTGLNLGRLGGLTLDFDFPGPASVCIDNVSLKSDRAMKMPIVKSRPQQLIANRPAALPRFERALWLWSTEKMLDDPAQAEELLSLCAVHGITQIWAQLLYDIQFKRRGSQVADSTCVIQRESAYRRFLKTAHAAGIQVHALEGYPEHAQRQYHQISLAIVDAVIVFNQNQPPAERFDGIHFDNEPHLLVGWHDPQRREQILFEYLTLNNECQRRVREAKGELQFGVDIPFWLQDRDQRRNEAIGVVTFNGRRQAASYHLLDMLDNVGVMNYRDTAQGADGMISHARDLLAYADRGSQAKIYMGVETISHPPTKVLFAVGRPRAAFEQAVRSDSRELAMLSRIDGHRIRVFDDGKYVHVGIELTETTTIDHRMAIANAISKIATALGAQSVAGQQFELGESIQDSLCRVLETEKGWSNVKPLTVRDPATGQIHQLVKADAKMQEKITFGDDNEKRFSSQIKAAEEYFSRHSCYAGIAIHDYDSFRAILQAGQAIRRTAR